MRIVFARKPVTLQEVLALARSSQAHAAPHRCDEVYVAAEVEVNGGEWRDLSEWMLGDRSWIRDFSARNYPARNGVTPCLRVTTEGVDYALLINPSGYSYARYVAIDPD